VLYDDILASALPDDPYMTEDLVDYFPSALRKSYRKQIGEHRLRREIVATVVTNEIVNRVGLAFLHEVQEKTGMPAEDIARAYIISREIFGIPALWAGIEALDNKAPAADQSAMLIECGRLIERETVWLLREVSQPLDIKGEIAAFGTGVAELSDNLEGFLSEADREALAQRAQDFVGQGVPDDLARRIASLALLAPACDIVRIADAVDQPVSQVATAYFGIGARFGFDWLRRAAGHLPTDTAWDKLAVTAVVDDLFGHQGQLTQRVLETAGNGAAEGVIDDWAEARRPLVARTEQLLAELQSTGSPDFAMLAVANRQLKSLVGS
jgi:glutamate dehydrogenase